MGSWDASCTASVWTCGLLDALWPGVHETPCYASIFPKWPKISWTNTRNLGKILGDEGCNFIDKLLVYSPSQRMSCRGCLNHPFMTSWQKHSFDAPVWKRPLQDTENNGNSPSRKMTPFTKKVS